jgi:hypothetical protein
MITIKEQLDQIKDAVETAIIQAAEVSGLRDWLVYHHLKNLITDEDLNEEMIVLGVVQLLEIAFEGIIDDRENNEANASLQARSSSA